ncbi:MAG TPA: MarR family transcriptional regulator, partial [Solirubrobacteraceae bacterium]|nr:MarR family transcriptional regulator [Solirubrobacteraceae bacterium]
PLAFDPIAEARRQWEAHWGSEAVPQMAAVTSIMRAQQILLMRLNGLLEPFELTFPRYETLMVLAYSRHGELPLGKLSDRLQVHRASVTNVIDKLEASGYVARVGHERDRRTILARITERGRETAERATRALNGARFAVDPLEADECERLFEALTPLRRDAGDF